MRLAGAASGKLDLKGRSAPRRAEDQDVAVEGVDAVLKPDDARTLTRVRAADAIVADRESQGAVQAGHPNVHHGCVRVLGGIGERLRDDVVSGPFEVLG